MYLHTSQKCWEQRSDDLDNKQDMQGAIVIKWINQSKWSTYYSSHYCIDAMKQYRCIAKIQITLYCNMTNQSLFARYVMYNHKYNNKSLMLFGCFWHFEGTIYKYIRLIHKIKTVEQINCHSYSDYYFIKASWSRKFLISLEYEFEKNVSWLKEFILLDLRTKNLIQWINLSQYIKGKGLFQLKFEVR